MPQTTTEPEDSPGGPSERGHEPTIAADLWPFNRNTAILDREMAAAIRRWALTDGGMSEAELHALSQRQALHRYVTGYLGPTLQRLLKTQRPPEESDAGANRVLFGTEPPADDVERMLWEALHHG